MGAKQKKCPECGKRRRFREGGDPYEALDRARKWTFIEHKGWVCNMCVAKMPKCSCTQYDARDPDDRACFYSVGDGSATCPVHGRKSLSP